jgi:predicted Zn-dependent protease
MVAVRRTLSLLACLFLATAPYAQPLPDLGDISSATLSDSQERTIGNKIMREVHLDPAYIDDPEISDYISALGARLLSASEGPPRKDLDFFAVQDETINAFALPGGHIGVHSALFLLTQSESELAGVVGHEIAHILQKHQARMMAGMGRAQWASLAAIALAVLAGKGSNGNVGDAALVATSALQVQNMLDYSREHEREADRVGLTLLERAGYDPRGMATFFERLLRANRLNEFKGAPSYLRTHPLTTERIADMQDRLDKTPVKLVPDSFEYRIARARLRVASMSANEAVTFFRNQLADKTILRPRDDVYGLALALKRARDFDGAWKTLAPLREGAGHPAFELLAAQIRADEHRNDEALAIYKVAVRRNPGYRALAYGYYDLMLQTGHAPEVLAEMKERLRMTTDDARYYEFEARAFEASGRRLSQYRAQAEALYRKGNLAGAVEQLEMAVKMKGSDFYEVSSAESRLRELRVILDNERAAEKALKIS